MSGARVRVLLAKVGLDGHDRGAKVVALALRNTGFEVIYTGLRQTPEMVVAAAIQEDVDVIGVSLLSGAHLEVMARICELLREHGADDILVMLGGSVPPGDEPALRAAGVHGVFPTESRFADIVSWIEESVPDPRTRGVAGALRS